MNILARVLNFSLMIAMPVVLAIYLVRRLKTAWSLFGLGAVTFVLSQALHIPFNLWVLNPLVDHLGLSLSQVGFQLAATGLLYGLSAGLFEEIARYLGFRFWIKEARQWKSALMYGAGHGGIESILLGCLVMIAFFQLVTLQGSDLSAVVNADQVELVQAQIEGYWAAPWYLALLGAVERLATIPFHLSAAVIVLQSARSKQISWLALAVGWHALVDAVAIYASKTWNPYITEGIILIAGMISLGIVFGLKSRDVHLHGDQFQVERVPEPQVLEVQSIEPSTENLDESRYV